MDDAVQPLTLQADSRDDVVVADATEQRKRRSAGITLFALVRKVWPFMRPTRLRVCFLALLSLFLTALEVATPILVGAFE